MNFQKINVVVFALLILLTVASLLFLPEYISYLIVKELGPVENAQVIFFMTGALVSWIYGRRKIWDGGFQGSLILLIFAMRELDFQKRFTGISITRTKYYFHSDAPLVAKLLCAVIVMSIIVLFILFIKNNIKVFLQDVRAHKSWSLSVLAGLLAMFFAIFVDSSLRVLGSPGAESINHVNLLKTALEELLELAIPFFFLNALLLYGKQTKTWGKPDN